MIILDRDKFENDERVLQFCDFIVEMSKIFPFHLNFKKSAKVPGGIDSVVIGFSGVLNSYKWNASCTDLNRQEWNAENWAETRALLGCLSSDLKGSLDKNDSSAAQQACFNILKWGGDRNHRVGATQDIIRLHNAGNLVSYLKFSRDFFSRSIISEQDLICVPHTGSMWTKIYALNSHDSLPIYDSRVAMALVGILHSFIKSKGINDFSNDLLKFRVPVGTNWERNKKSGVNFDTVEKISKDHPYWSIDTLKLSWLSELVLARSDLFSDQGPLSARKHALEATLFMIGYDLKSIFQHDIQTAP